MKDVHQRSSQTVGTSLAGLVVLLVTLSVARGWVNWLAVEQSLRPHGLLIGGFGISAVLLGASGLKWARARRPPRGPIPPLSWWAVAAAAAAIAAVAWGATYWLLQEARQAKDPAAARVEAVKTGLGIGAGTGGVFALLLAVRRQWHQEISAAATEHDAAERRLTDLYLKAVEQLGSAQPAVRHGGLYALERVAQDNSAQRQTVVDVICAYLRSPYTAPPDVPAVRRLGVVRRPLLRSPSLRAAHVTRPAGTTPPQITASDEQQRQEREVRLTAQRILHRHLTPGNDRKLPVDTFWDNIDLNLAGAVLIAFDFGGGKARTATFKSATFSGDANFESATFTHAANFESATFTHDTDFESATFTRHAYFGSATFTGLAYFGSVTFSLNANFQSATFAGDANFESATFTHNANFRSATFTHNANFESATFHNVYFRSATFTDNASFELATFTRDAEFTSATFTRDAEFTSATFTRHANFGLTSFNGGAYFRSVRFSGSSSANFIGATFAMSMPTELEQFLQPSEVADEST